MASQVAAFESFGDWKLALGLKGGDCFFEVTSELAIDFAAGKMRAVQQDLGAEYALAFGAIGEFWLFRTVHCYRIDCDNCGDCSVERDP